MASEVVNENRRKAMPSSSGESRHLKRCEASIINEYFTFIMSNVMASSAIIMRSPASAGRRKSEAAAAAYATRSL